MRTAMFMCCIFLINENDYDDNYGAVNWSTVRLSRSRPFHPWTPGYYRAIGAYKNVHVFYC